MKYAILSDVHAFPPALEKTLEDAVRCEAEKILCLGDVVGYGPDAERTIEIVRERVDVTLMGNHDAAVSAVITGAGFSLTALRGVRRHRDETSVGARQWLAALPYTYEEDGFACAHGEFSKPEAFRYVMDPEDALPSWDVRKEPLLFVGHTHKARVMALDGDGAIHDLPIDGAIVLRPDWRYLVNVGSVGYPRNDQDSMYCLYDADRRIIEFRRLSFDSRTYRKEMRKHDAELPKWFDILF